MVLIIPNRSGDTKKSFDVSIAADVAAAKEEFDKQRHEGRVAVSNRAEGKTVITSLDPVLDSQVIFIPSLQGG